MANLRYSNKHNMVAFLKKPTESVGFTEIVDFIKGTSLRYTLTHNPTIYDSLVKQLWQTATVRSLANGIQELVASIHNKEYTITEASVRSKLQLAVLTINGFEISLPVAVCSGVANALVQYYGALITIQFLVNCQPSTDLRSLYQSRLLWTSQFLMSVRHGELMTICYVVTKPTLNNHSQSFVSLKILAPALHLVSLLFLQFPLA
ncbi:hypothetical protein Tco_0732490 [Tanacetum coccineum]